MPLTLQGVRPYAPAAHLIHSPLQDNAARVDNIHKVTLIARTHRHLAWLEVARLHRVDARLRGIGEGLERVLLSG